ncbi:hypothetical protein HPP92_018234 [Vanilla planifolia]|uniref:BHLH domain-containing protein n=1 Tax=Vanilla planifolia TaxID=51239 RepID=A0A835Q6P3_VANPL|nr:hypothetical protein HPP92_018234 [Vanilla planifolia]
MLFIRPEQGLVLLRKLELLLVYLIHCILELGGSWSETKMDMGEKEKLGLEKSCVDSLNCHASGLVATEWNQIGPSSYPSASMVDSFGRGMWNQPSNSSFSDAQEAAASSSVGKPLPLSWNLSDSLTKGGMFVGIGPGIHPFGLSRFPSDPGFIDGAARFSCFTGAANPFLLSNASNAISGTHQMQKNEAGKMEAFRDRSASIDHSPSGGSPLKGQREKEINEISEEFSSEASPNSSQGGLAARKRKMQDMDWDQRQSTAAQLPAEAAKDATDSKLKAEQNSSTMATVKPSGKNSKEGGETPKEDYIHVRARRGQATNSHSLAERVRREKISERMKFLQDLVPGCSKVTGKAVMLDEIINYVQSLQRQVEFLSMKLAAVNPRIDFNIESLLTKDLLQSRTGSSSAIGFSPDMIHHQLHQPHQGLMQLGMPGIMNTTDAFRRAVNVQFQSSSPYKEAAQQLPNAWDDDLHNVIQMTYGNSPPIKTQDLNGVPHEGFH